MNVEMKNKIGTNVPFYFSVLFCWSEYRRALQSPVKYSILSLFVLGNYAGNRGKNTNFIAIVSLLHFPKTIFLLSCLLYIMTKCSYGYDIYYDQSLYSVVLYFFATLTISIIFKIE